jgi:carotenoid cleavage dioxygenase
MAELDRRSLLAAFATGGVVLLNACGSDRDAPTTTTAAPPAPRVAHPDPAKPYWEQGNFAAVSTEEVSSDLEVTGSLPPELSGLFVRNGSNPPSGTSSHWFLGDGMLHGVRLQKGRAQWYRNRYVNTADHNGEVPAGSPPGGKVGQSNVSVYHHAGKLLSLGEVGWPYQIATADLSTVGVWDGNGRFVNNVTAHPKTDPATGRMHFFGYELFRPEFNYFVADRAGTVDHVARIELERAVMIHDFAITERDAVFWVGPVQFGLDPSGRNDIPFHWDPTGPCKLGVLPLDGDASQIRWVQVPPCFVFHGLNAHRDGDDIVVNLHRLDEAFGPRGDLVESYLTEWRVGTAGSELTLSQRRLFDRSMDLPTHDRRHTGRATRHGWCATTTQPKDSASGQFDMAGICHVDLHTGKEDLWEDLPNRHAGEGFFVPASDSAPEGEGWILTYLWDRRTDRSSFAVFDAQHVARGPVAEVQLPVRVPYGFHGWWVPESEL